MRTQRKNHALRRRVAEWAFRSRAAQDLTQEELAKRVGCKRTTIERIENETRGTTLDFVDALAAALGTTFTIGGGK